ncbi:MAG: tspO/MBR family protein [Candidatus Pelagibacter sp.]|nr:tspO/MBR family protein [Candidatus Pelagibacter sp.]|tara:strand:+ start:3352 stop:3831 length:480 start_codon:yes stop_codon:yes gene_type:complete
MVKNYKSLIFILLITFLSSFIAGFITQLNIDPWYQSLNKLSFSPPNWIFGPVWTVLYAFMSIAIWVVYEKSKKSDLIFSKKILRYYFYHLAINLSWSFIFFYFHLIFFAFINILVLIITIIFLMYLYFPRSKISFILMVPYLLWITFAAVLNLGLYLIN